MPKRISKKLKDSNQIAAAVVAAATDTDPLLVAVTGQGKVYLGENTSQSDREAISRVMSEMGRKGGKIGGKKSLETMTPGQRKKRAKKAADARWKKS